MKYATLFLFLVIVFSAQAQWQPLPPLGINENMAVDFPSASEGWMFSKDGGVNGPRKLFHSTDGGNTWTDVEIIPGQAYEAIALSFPTIDTGYTMLRYNGGAGLRLGIFRTTNRGATWVDVTPDSAAVGYGYGDIRFHDDHTGYLAVGGYIFHTTTAGATWSVMGSSFTNVAPNSVAILDPMHAAIGYWDGTFAYMGGVLITDDGGVTWDTTHFQAYYSEVADVSYPATNTILAVSKSNGFNSAPNLHRTFDGGTTWDTVALGFVLDSMTRPVSMHFKTVSDGVIALEDGQIYATTDGGISWNQSIDIGEYLNNMIFRNGVGYAVGNAGFVYSTDPFNSVRKPVGGALRTRPNPATDWLQFELAEGQTGEAMLYSVAGVPVRTVPVQNGAGAMELSELANGIYLLEVKTPHGLYHGRVMVQH